MDFNENYQFLTLRFEQFVTKVQNRHCIHNLDFIFDVPLAVL